MKHRVIVFCAFILFFFFIIGTKTALSDDWPLSIRQLSLGFTAMAEKADPLLIFPNPSAPGVIQKWSVSSSYSRPYGMKELDIAALGLAKRWRKIVIAAGISNFGFELFKEQKFIFGLVIPIIKNLPFGIAFRYQRIDIKNYGHTTAYTIDMGWQYKILPGLDIMGAVQNVRRATIGQDRQPLPQILRMGMLFKPVSQISMFSEVYKDISFGPEARFGIDAEVVKKLFLRLGFTRNPARFTGGFGLNVFGFNMDYGFSYHQVLGYTHAMGLVISADF